MKKLKYKSFVEQFNECLKAGIAVEVEPLQPFRCLKYPGKHCGSRTCAKERGVK